MRNYQDHDPPIPVYKLIIEIPTRMKLKKIVKFPQNIKKIDYCQNHELRRRKKTENSRTHRHTYK